VGPVAAHLGVQIVGEDQVVGKLQAVGLHWVGRAIIIVTHSWSIVIRNTALRAAIARY